MFIVIAASALSSTDLDCLQAAPVAQSTERERQIAERENERVAWQLRKANATRVAFPGRELCPEAFGRIFPPR